MVGLGVGFGLVAWLLVYLGYEEFRRRGILNEKSSALLSAVSAFFSAAATIGLGIIGYEQWQVQAHTDAVQAATSRAWVFPTSFETKGPPALGQNFVATLSFRNGGPVPAFHVQRYFDDPEVVPLSKILGGLSTLDARASDLMRRAIQSSGGLLGGSDSCAEASKSLIESVEYPSPLGTQMSLATAGSHIDQAVLDGTSAIFIKGCFVYETAGTPHHSRFCYLYNTTLIKGRPDENAWLLCPSGVDAD
jgi:hypothetical protein